MVIMAMEAMATMDMAKGLLIQKHLLSLRLSLQLLQSLDMDMVDMVMDMVIMDMVTMAMEAMDIMDMERGRLKQNLDMDMVMDMDTMDNIYRRSLFQIFYHCS